MSHSRCFRCGVLTDSVLPAPLCVTCHGREDETQRPQAASTNTPTAAFAPPTTDAVTQTNPADPFGVLPAGGYRYGRLLGQGGMGCVYQAVRGSTGQTVAIKKLRAERYFPGLIQRFVLEARILSRLDHPNVVRLLDFVPAAGDPHIVMEFVDGQSLADRVVDGRPLAADTAARLIADAARGVQAVHDAGVIHRDLKPGNLLVTADGRVKVTDFGLGKLTEADDGLTVVGGPVGGTPGYSAPEQVAESGASDARTDVWGLGACLYAALTGRPPFLVGRANLTRVLSDPLVPPRAFNRHVPPVLDAIVCKCLERDPHLRYQSAADLADDLDRYRRGESTVARPLPWTARAWRRARAVPRATAAAWAMTAVAVTVAVALAGFAPARGEAGLPKKPDRPLAELPGVLREDRPFTLVPPRGRPVTTEWLFGEVPIALREDGSEVAFLRTGDGPSAVLFRPQ
ncbi:MAG: serine/threonine-protein kinase, partial [Gemmataceae bacterium]